MWSTGEGNGKPLQYSCLENPMNSMKRQNYRILKEELPRLVGAGHATGDQWKNMYNIMYETSCQSRFDAWYWMLGAGALGWPRRMVLGGRWEGGSGLGTCVHPWQMHVDVWQNQYNIVKYKNNKNYKKEYIVGSLPTSELGLWHCFMHTHDYMLQWNTLSIHLLSLSSILSLS